MNACAYDDWFKQHLAGVEGLWIGYGVADQYLLKVGKLTTDLYEEVGATYGYFIAKGRATLVKLLSDQSAGEVQ